MRHGILEFLPWPIPGGFRKPVTKDWVSHLNLMSLGQLDICLPMSNDIGLALVFPLYIKRRLLVAYSEPVAI